MRDKNQKYILVCLIALLSIYAYNTFFKPLYIESKIEKQIKELSIFESKLEIFKIRDSLQTSSIQALKDSIARIDYQFHKATLEKPKYQILNRPKSKSVTNLEAKGFVNVDEKRILEIMKKYQK